MDLRILEIASNTENNKVLDNFTHQSKNKNPICGDEMEISLIVKNDKVVDMGYQCKSCVYCQASVSLLSQKIKNKRKSKRKEDTGEFTSCFSCNDIHNCDHEIRKNNNCITVQKIKCVLKIRKIQNTKQTLHQMWLCS